MSWDLSCRDWEARLASGRSLVPELRLDKVEADRAVSVYNALKLPDVVGTPTLGEASGEWFREIVRALFGSVIDGERLIRELKPRQQRRDQRVLLGTRQCGKIGRRVHPSVESRFADPRHRPLVYQSIRRAALITNALPEQLQTDIGKAPQR